MCGILGFFSENGEGPNIDRLKRIATETERRGRHAFGLAWLTADGKLRSYKRPGAATDDLSDLDAVKDAIIVIGHCRWATHGDPEENENNHPHRAGSGWLIHNGVITNHYDLVDRYNLDVRTACDSEVLGLMFSRGRGTVEDRGVFMANAADGTLAVLGVWANPGRMLIVRRDKPIWTGRSSRGRYFGSFPRYLPGKPRAIRNETARVLTFRKTAGLDLVTPDVERTYEVS